MTTGRTATGATSESSGTNLWIALIAGLTVVGSYGLACVAPLAAVAALAALTLRRTEGLLLVLIAWIANQAIGFMLLSYPHTADTYAWGAAIGVAAVLGYLAAVAVTPVVTSRLAATLVAFAVAFAVYQLALYAYGIATGYAGDSFSLSIVGDVLAINAVAYAGFLLLHRAAVALALVKPVRPVAAVSA